VGHAACIKLRNAYKILARNFEGKKSLGRPRHKWDDTKMDHKETGCENVN
jgi:hypothetical protein